MVTIALDAVAEHAHRFIDVASPTHPSLVDATHVTDELLGFTNVPMAIWVDEHGRIVRPAEYASVERSPLRDLDVPEGLPDRMRMMFEQVKAIPDVADDYRAAVADWVERGSASPFALAPVEVVRRSRPVGREQAEAAACFELGHHLLVAHGHDAAVPWWRRAHQLDPANWTYKRQAWTLVTTPEGAEVPDLLQGPNDTYAGNWLDDVVAAGGGERYYDPFRP